MALLFGQGVIFTSVTLIQFACGWYGLSRQGVRLGRRIRSEAKQLFTERKSHRSRPSVLAAVVALLLAAQAAWLVTNFIVGCVISVLFNYNKTVPQQPHLPGFGLLVQALRWDAVSGTYLVLSIVALLMSYRSAAKGDDEGGPGLVFLIPGFLGFIGGLLAVIGLLFFKYVGQQENLTTREIVFAVGITIISAAYMFTTQQVLRAPAIVRSFFGQT